MRFADNTAAAATAAAAACIQKAYNEKVHSTLHSTTFRFNFIVVFFR